MVLAGSCLGVGSHMSRLRHLGWNQCVIISASRLFAEFWGSQGIRFGASGWHPEAPTLYHLVRALVFIPSLFWSMLFVVRIWFSELSTTLLEVVVAEFDSSSMCCMTHLLWIKIWLAAFRNGMIFACSAVWLPECLWAKLRVLTPHEFEETYFFYFLKFFDFLFFSKL